MSKPFLSAQWENLLVFNYVVPTEALTPFVPEFCELDLYRGKCLVSIVAFQFRNTQVMGFKIPWHINFPEINLRFYVKRRVGKEVRRGVVFIAEIVPRFAITFVANTFFNENYRTRTMTEYLSVGKKTIDARYAFREKDQMQELSCVADMHPIALKRGSLEEFITEHYYGYVKGKKTLEYQVEHPQWRTFKMKKNEIKLDFGLVYGTHWNFLQEQRPHSVLLAEGSGVNVYPATKVDKNG